MNHKTVAIIGAGAAGCFAAINIKRLMPTANVTIYEGGTRPLAKLAVTGGGRCNLTNSFNNVKSLESVYPRGHRLLKRLFHEFSHEDAFKWFENEGVRLVTQDDECVFPKSQNAMEIVNLLLRRCSELGVEIKTSCRITALKRHDNRYTIECKYASYTADKVLVATGGCPRMSGFHWLDSLNLDIVPPVPSLFSVALKTTDHHDNPLTSLSGTVVPSVTVGIIGTKLRTSGTLLITHWGISGPALLCLSSIAARYLAEHDYQTSLSINWLGGITDSAIAQRLDAMAAQNPQKQLQSIYPSTLNSRLWQHLISKSNLSPTSRWAEMSRKSVNRLANTLANDNYLIAGRWRHKEEFVTCGGISLSNLNPKTLECKHHPGLYFAGEATDIDAVTGGFNLQAAWTMGYVAAQAISHAQS